MKVSVFGLGYVGSVSAASFAADGHTVVGVDVNPTKVQSLNEGRSPIVEKGLDELIRDAVANGSLRATTDTSEAIAASELSLVCVGTPSRRNGSLDLTYLERVCEQIGEALRDKTTHHVVVVRSTVLPGTTHDVVIPALERSSGKKYGTGFGVTVNPEFLREGTAIQDFRNPPLTLVGHNYASDATPDRGALQHGASAAHHHQHPNRGNDQVREQHLACAQGLLRERSWKSLQAAGYRQPRSHGHLLS